MCATVFFAFRDFDSLVVLVAGAVCVSVYGIGYLSTWWVLRSRHEEIFTRVGMTARTGPSPYRNGRPESHS